MDVDVGAGARVVEVVEEVDVVVDVVEVDASVVVVGADVPGADVVVDTWA